MLPHHRDLLIACTATGPGSIDALNRYLEQSPIEQTDYVSAELLPLLYRHLANQDIDHPVRPRLRYFYRKTWHHNQTLLYRALPVFAELERLDCPAVVLKGGAMSSSLYHGDLGVRPLFDLDVLVPEEFVETIVDWSFQAGWSLVDGSVWDREGYLTAHHAIDLRHGDDGALDIHHQLLATDRSPDLDRELIAASVPAMLGSQSVRVFECTSLLLHTFAHAKPEGLRHLGDALSLIAKHREEIDWDHLCTQLADRRSTAPALETINKLIEINPEAIPTWVPARLVGDSHHWSDWSYQDRTVTSRRAGLRAYITQVSQRSRGEGPISTARIAWLVARQYGEVSQAGGLGRKFRSFVFRGPTGRVTPTAAEPQGAVERR